MPNPVGEPVLHFWYCFIRVRTTCRLLNSGSFPGVFQGINKKIQDPKVVNFTSIFFHTSYLQKKNGPKKYFLFLQLSLIDKFKEFSRSWCQNWIFKEFSRVLEKSFNFQEFLGIPGVVGTLFHMLYMEVLKITLMKPQSVIIQLKNTEQ